MAARILTGSYPYGKFELLYDYLKFVSRAIAENKFSKKSGRSDYCGKLLGFQVVFLSYVQLLTLIEEIFIAEVYKVSLLKKTPVIIDCGSHIGLSVLYFKKVFPKCTISAFEPDPDLFRLLKQNISQNNLENVSSFNVALSDSVGDKILFKETKPESLLSTELSSSNAGFTVRTEKLSNFVNHDIDVMKIDVEGSEDVIVHELILSKAITRVNQFIIEFHPQFQLKPIEHFVSQLEQSGFGVTWYKDNSRPGINDYLVYAKRL